MSLGRSNKFLCPDDVLYHDGNVGSASNAPTRLPQAEIWRWKILLTAIAPAIAEIGTWRARYDAIGIPELRSVQREHVLQHKLSCISASPVIVAFRVEADDIPTFG